MTSLLAATMMALAAMPAAVATAEQAPEARDTRSVCAGASYDNPYEDAFSANPHHRQILCMTRAGLAQGFVDGTYRPSSDVSRDQMATFIANLIEHATGEELPEGGHEFDDAVGSPHYEAIHKLANAGVVQGRTSDTYAPRASVRRDQMATFIHNGVANATGVPMPAANSVFSDVDSANDHAEAISAIAEQGIAVGYGNDTYGPADDVRRDQMASFIMRAYDYIAETQIDPGPAVGSISGSVTQAGSDGGPIAGATVFIEGTDTEGTTTEDGAYTLEDVAAGEHTVTAAAGGFEPDSQTVPVEPGQQVEDVDFALALAPGSVSVQGSVEQIHVSHAEPEVEVSVRGPDGYSLHATTDEGGGLVLRDVPAGEGYTVEVDGAPGTFAVAVLGPDEHPDADFYAAQQLDPSQGYLTTRDGTLLAYQVELPDPDEFGSGPYPVVVDYSAYRPSIDFFDGVGSRFPELGYAAVGVNMRGSACSGGAFDYFEQLQWLDGYDMVETLGAQRWSDGVALIGKSYPGISQLFVASTQPPSLDAIVPGHVVGEFYRDVAYPGGVLNFAFAAAFSADQDERSAFPSSYPQVNERAEEDPVCLANQALRGQNVSMEELIFGSPLDGGESFWPERAPERLVGDITVPTLLVNAWQDEQTGGGPAKLMERFAADAPARMVATNGDHDEYYRGDVWAEIVGFLDVYLGEEDPQQVADYEAEPPVTILLELDREGSAGTSFAVDDLTDAADAIRFSLGEELVPDDGEADGASSSFTYDPPPLLEEGWLMPDQNEWLPPTQDQVAFTSDPLDEDTVIAGSGSVDLWVAAEAEDVDLEVTLSEIRPDGSEMLIQSGWLRASHRELDEDASTELRPRHVHTAEAQQPLEPGKLTEMRVELFPVAHAFREDSQIRLTIDGPGGNRWRWGFLPHPGPIEVTVAHDEANPSALVLPVVDVDVELPAMSECGTVSSQPCRPIE